MKYYDILKWVSKPNNLWGIIFVYTILCGLFVQLILLPYIIPSWHAGNGLLRGVDGPEFHKTALELSKSIKEHGWSQWELRPDGQLVSGIAAIFYTLIYPAPWSVLPINALLNASGGVCLYFILANLIDNRQNAFIASLPFIFFPSNLLWNTQFHNENYAVPGVIFILFGWLLISRRNEGETSLTYSDAASAVLSVIFGSFLLGLVRFYILRGMLYLFIFVGVSLIIYWFFKRGKFREYSIKWMLVMMLCSIMWSITYIIKPDKQGAFDSTKHPSGSESSVKWSDVRWLPTVINHQLQDIAKDRSKFVKGWSDAGSSIDLNITFKNANDMIAYIPRSLQIGFLSPFPNMWFSEGKKAAGSGMRAASAIEMIVAYFCLLGLPVFIWKNRKQPAVWMLVFVCCAMLSIYAMIIPNIGALYRFRYPYYMPLVCFGLVSWIEYFTQIRTQKTP